MTDQLILKFPSKKIYLKEDFYVSPSNQEAYDFINTWPKWIKRIVNIFGPSGSGKTHIVSFLKNKTSTLEINSSELNDEVFYVEVDPLNLKNARVETTKQPPHKLSESNINDDGLVIKAPINGIVIKYLVSEGDQVSTGQDIVVLEAMKMENTLPSPASGIVKKLTQEVGVKVDKGTVLAIIEANH